MEFNKLRVKYPKFVYEKYSFEFLDDDLIVIFNFSILPNIYFNPRIIIRKIPDGFSKNYDKDILENLIFNLGLIEIPSYWKSTCSPIISIKAGYLNNEQLIWWKDLYLSGMGQFYFENNIDHTKGNFLIIKSSADEIKAFTLKSGSKKVLIPVGGGKDSVVTLELLKDKFDTGVFIVKPVSPAALRISEDAGLKTIVVERNIDPKLLELNKKGFLNGHTPITAVMHFISILVSYIYDYKYVAFSNERSSDEENTIFKGMKINHQYSKSLALEKKFAEYNSIYLSNIKVFSFLRPLQEIQIAKIFSRFDKYLSQVRSCNIGQKDDNWCLNCPKCLSTYILLFPFIGRKMIIDIFSEDLFEREDLKEILFDLIDEGRLKPFECVGTREELTLALYRSSKMYNKDLPVLLRESKKYWDKIKNIDLLNENIMKSWGDDTNIPTEFLKVLRSAWNDHVHV